MMTNIAGRNDPCPCNSGKKYKKCCMPQQNVSTAIMYGDNEGVHVVGKGNKPSKAELENMTKKYQENIKKSPLWDEMVKEYGQEKAEQMLKEFKVKTR